MKLYSRLVIYQFETNDIISLKCQARQSTCNDRNYAYIKSAVQNGNGCWREMTFVRTSTRTRTYTTPRISCATVYIHGLLAVNVTV